MNQQGVVIQHCGKPRVPPIPLLKGWHDFTFIPHIPYPQPSGGLHEEASHRRHVFRFRVGGGGSVSTLTPIGKTLRTTLARIREQALMWSGKSLLPVGGKSLLIDFWSSLGAVFLVTGMQLQTVDTFCQSQSE